MAKLKSILTLLAFAHLAVSIPRDYGTTTASNRTLIGCLDAANVPLISASDADYAPAVMPFNLRLPFFPVAVVVPTTAEHISSAIKCANTFKTKVAARSGGHSYAAYGLGGADGSLMIDMKMFRHLSVDPDTYVATVGAGLRLGDVASGIYRLAKRGLPHGTCPGVGISGHALHGGFGFTSRMWGTTLDNIVEMEVVLANGDIVTVSKRTDPDLFWALRGAGSSFGIVTTFKFTTYPEPNSGVRFSWSWTLDDSASDTVEKKVKIFQALQDFSEESAPDTLVFGVFMMAGFLDLSGVYWGSRAEFDRVIAPLVASLPQDGLPTPQIADYTYIDLLVVLANGEQLPQPENYTKHDTFFTKSIVAPTKLTSESLTSFFTFISEKGVRPPLSWFVIADLYGGRNSKISSQDPADSSYGIRDSFFTFQLYSNLDGADPSVTYPPWGIEYMNEMSRSITEPQPETKFGAYVNYVDPSLSPKEAHELYYGPNYQRLKELKRRYDPELLLWNPQAIGTS
ncbi:Glucooligosaccharide oxidase [Tuber magnatum]|uniref:Glucooligosaccharide oxidase n=1 Tax=Tuber magnatum TaxID=42249 RepID=A0A317SRA8_9PEZI|nr:Glucooligosaccharide oxidase [Tuber magnatum]